MDDLRGALRGRIPRAASRRPALRTAPLRGAAFLAANAVRKLLSPRTLNRTKSHALEKNEVKTNRHENHSRRDRVGPRARHHPRHRRPARARVQSVDRSRTPQAVVRATALYDARRGT